MNLDDAVCAVACACESELPLLVEWSIRSGGGHIPGPSALVSKKAAIERLLLSGIYHQAEGALAKHFPGLSEYLLEELKPKPFSAAWCQENAQSYQLYACYLRFLESDRSSPLSLILLIFGLYQTPSTDLRSLAILRTVKALGTLCLCPVIDSIHHLVSNLLAKTVAPNVEGLADAVALIMLTLFISEPVEQLTETDVMALEMMVESVHLDREATYERTRAALDTLWQFGVELGSANPKSSRVCQSCTPNDARSLLLPYVLLRALDLKGQVPSSLSSRVLTSALFPADSPLKHTPELITRVLLLFREFFRAGAVDDLKQALELHCADQLDLILPLIEEAPLETITADTAAAAELERRNALRLSTSLFEPVFTDEEVARVSEIQNILIKKRTVATGHKPVNIPKKGYLLAAYRFALNQTQNWMLAVDQVQSDPERFQKLMTGPFKNLPFYTSPSKLMDIMVARKFRRAGKQTADDFGPSVPTIDPELRDKTLKLAREQEGQGIDDYTDAVWGTQKEAEEALARVEERNTLEEQLAVARLEVAQRQEFKHLPLKERRKVEKANAAAAAAAAAPPAPAVSKPTGGASKPAPVAAAEPADSAVEADDNRAWGPDKMKGGRVPRPKQNAVKRKQTYDKHHARDRRDNKGA